MYLGEEEECGSISASSSFCGNTEYLLYALSLLTVPTPPAERQWEHPAYAPSSWSLEEGGREWQRGGDEKTGRCWDNFKRCVDNVLVVVISTLWYRQLSMTVSHVNIERKQGH